MVDSRPAAVPARVGGRYVLRGEIGRGGMATVHRAHDEVLHREVAVKLLHPHLAGDPAFLERFRREARSAAVLAHPNVVTVHDWGETADEAYLILQHVEGGPLRDVLRERGPLDPLEALAVLVPAAEGLGAAHAAGLVHRDVKPENLLLSIDGSVQVTDFGLARAAASATQTFGADVLVGSPHYLSPEAVRGEPLEPAADVYALGVVLFECLTGRPPHEGDSPYATAMAHTARRVPPPSSLRADLPPALDRVVRRATDPDPANRHPDGTALARDLRAAMGDPVLPPVPVPAGAGPVAGTTTLFAEDHPRGDTTALDWDEGPEWVETGAVTRVGMAGAGTAPAGSAPAAAPPGGGDVDGADEDGDADDEQAPAARRPRRRLRALLLIVALLAASAAGGYLLWDRVLAPVVEVPAVSGAPVEDAVASLEEAGLQPAVADEREHHLEVPAEHVLRTVPDGQARQGDEVTLVVSAGPRQVEVPEVVGRTRSEASEALEEAGLTPVAEEQYHEEVAEGTVISQQPAAGEVLDETSEVTVAVSLGPEPIEVPDLSGTGAQEAEQRIEELGLRFDVTERRYADQPSGTVLSQEPAAGEVRYRGDAVSVVVSDGPEPIEVPNLRGESADAAVEQLRELGFEVELERRGGFGAFLSPGEVFDQDPAPGSERQPGETVTLYAYED